MIERVYVEIGNICNLSCSFCPGTSRAPRRMTREEFSAVCEKIKGSVKYVYLHVMGEPLAHPDLCGFLSVIRECGLRVCITTNGTLLDSRADTLLS